ncbi:hypothetical protein [Spirillospora sp. NPDC047279]|uniref:Gp37-like protein n=1 Tax=Spirillospora sp. NPDC047279 TaxID=3155478 RepID=UPI0033C10229
MPLIGRIDGFLSFESIERHLDVGAWTLTLPAKSADAELIRPGRGITVFLDSNPDSVAFSGPIRSIKVSTTQETGGDGLMTVSGVCDNVIVRERLGRIQPRSIYAREDETVRQWQPVVYSGGAYRAPVNSGEFIWGLLAENLICPELVSGGDTSRRIRYLDMTRDCPASISALAADDLWQSYPVQMSAVEDAVWDLARLTGLTVRFRYDATTGLIKPTIRPSIDLSQTIVFDEAAGNLAGYEFTSEAPTNTRVFLAGATPATDGGRRFYELRRSDLWNPPGWQDIDTTSNPALWSDPWWGRKAIEVEWGVTAEGYVDVRETKWAYQSNPASPGAALPPPPGSAERRLFDRQALAYLVENTQRGLVTLDALDTDKCRYGLHYNIGDTVRALLNTSALPESMLDADGLLRQPIQEVRIACSADEMWLIQPKVGGDESSSTPYVYRMIRRLRRQVEATKNRY